MNAQADVIAEPDDFGSGKTHRDENFPVASFVIHPRHRDIILAFYRFARAADDVADHERASPDEKLRHLDIMRQTLLGESDAARDALALRVLLRARGLGTDHAEDLLEAFRRDVTKTRYENFGELMEYCRFSAMPVGRFVLDVHGESRSLWPACDALCAALQILNHLQDCAQDYRTLDRVYIPLDEFSRAGLTPAALAEPRAGPALLGILRGMTGKTQTLLRQSAPFARGIRSSRLAFEVSVIQTLAENLLQRLLRKDPLSQNVHHGKIDALALIVPAFRRFAHARFSAARTRRDVERD
jgi:squalene synthase HpnC